MNGRIERLMLLSLVFCLLSLFFFYEPMCLLNDRSSLHKAFGAKKTCQYILKFLAHELVSNNQRNAVNIREYKIIIL